MVTVVPNVPNEKWTILGYTTNVGKTPKRMGKILFGYYFKIFLFNIEFYLFQENFYILITIACLTTMTPTIL